MQILSIIAQPVAGLFKFRQGFGDKAPEARRMVHLAQMGDLVSGNIVKNMRGRKYQTPGKGQGDNQKNR
jgi:hypothetical protein